MESIGRYRQHTGIETKKTRRCSIICGRSYQSTAGMKKKKGEEAVTCMTSILQSADFDAEMLKS